MVHAPEVGFILREMHPLSYHTCQDSSLSHLNEEKGADSVYLSLSRFNHWLPRRQE
jgi:hypothetical protein